MRKIATIGLAQKRGAVRLKRNGQEHHSLRDSDSRPTGQIAKVFLAAEGRDRNNKTGKHRPVPRSWIASSLALVLWVVVASPGYGAEARSGSGKPVPQVSENIDAYALPTPEPWRGDLDGMRERRVVRFLVPYNRTYYFIDRGRQLGIVHDAATEFVAGLNKKFKPKNKALRIRAVFIPVPRDKLIPGIEQGLGDIAAGAITVTTARDKIVDFTNPMAANVREVIVTGPGASPLTSIDDLAGRSVAVRRASSFYEHLFERNRDFKARGLAEIKLVALDEDLEAEDILEMVNARLIDITVADEPVAKVWQRVFKNVTIRSDLVVSEGGDLAWAIRNDSPLLKAEVNSFVKNHKMGSKFANIIIARYTSDKALRNSLSQEERERFEALSSIFKKYAEQYNFDHLMIMAQGFQESGLDQTQRSPRGAVGIMQLMPETAADKNVAVPDIDTSAEQNILAGVKYLRHLSDTYLDDPAIDDKNRTLMLFAAYNAGPGNLRKLRRIAEKSKLNPNVWFNNVEIAAARAIGRETVDYVSNIYKYYIAYKMALEREEGRAQSREELQQNRVR
jgi:membrane-bound lytic murein transglycosylase MltF